MQGLHLRHSQRRQRDPSPTPLRCLSLVAYSVFGPLPLDGAWSTKLRMGEEPLRPGPAMTDRKMIPPCGPVRTALGEEAGNRQKDRRTRTLSGAKPGPLPSRFGFFAATQRTNNPSGDRGVVVSCCISKLISQSGPATSFPRAGSLIQAYPDLPPAMPYCPLSRSRLARPCARPQKRGSRSLCRDGYQGTYNTSLLGVPPNLSGIFARLQPPAPRCCALEMPLPDLLLPCLA